MAIEQNVESIKSVLEILDKEDFSLLYAEGEQVQSWNNLAANEIRYLVEETLSVLRASKDADLLSTDHLII